MENDPIKIDEKIEEKEEKEEKAKPKDSRKEVSFDWFEELTGVDEEQFRKESPDKFFSVNLVSKIFKSLNNWCSLKMAT